MSGLMQQETQLETRLESQAGPGPGEVAHPERKGQRFEELDSLRGLAALVVFVYHCIFLLAICPQWLTGIVKSPAGLLVYGGHQAVILFFILSGFVLYLPYSKGGPRTPYLGFIAKRICRIYLPYLFAVALMTLAYLIFFNPRIEPGLSTLFGWRVLSRPQLFALLANHVVFIGNFHREYLNGATWTLAEEMRISFIFPLLATMVARWGSRIAMVVATVTSTLVSLGIHFIHHRSPLEPLHYAGLFVLGAVLCANRVALVDVWRRLGRVRQLMLVAISFLGCAYAPLLMERFPVPFTEEAADWLIALTASVFLISALAGTMFGAFLRHRVMQHLGRSSYGIYLLHLPVLFIAVTLLWTRVPHLVVYAISLGVTLISANLFYLFIERPSMALGKRLAHHLQQRRAARGRAAGGREMVQHGSFVLPVE